MALLLFVVFVVLPVAEIAVIIQVGQLIGPLWTVLLLLASAVIGSWLVRREGRRAWRAFRAAVESGRPPAREVADGALVLLGGALMITPGFITDAVGVLCLLPPTRALLRRALAGAATRRLLGVAGVRRVRSHRGSGRPYQDPPDGPPYDGSSGPRPRVIEGDVEH